MRTIPILLSAALLAVLLLSLMPAPASAAVSMSQFQKYQGPDLDFYCSPGSAVDLSELALVVDYSDLPDTVLVVDGNGTRYSETVQGHDSAFVVLQFPDLASYQILVNQNGHTLLTLNVARSANVLPPPVDQGSWHISPPSTNSTNPAYTWTQAMVDSMVGSLTMKNILIAAAVVAFGLMVGAAVKAFTKFLTPSDFITWSLMLLIFLDMAFQIFGSWNRLWYIVWIVGYFGGFLLWHVDYILPLQTDCTNKSIDVRPVAVYLPDDGSGYCIQTQKNKELLKRILGVPHRLGTDAGLPNDWVGRFKQPITPAVRGRITVVEKTEVKAEPAKIWLFSVKRFTTTLCLAHASGVSKLEWLNDVKAYFKIQDRYDRLDIKYNDLRLTHRTEAVGISAGMIEHATNVNPARRVSKWWGQDIAAPDLATGENVYTEAEEKVTKPQDAIAPETPEEAESIDYSKATPSNGPNRPKKAAAVSDEDEDQGE